MDKFRVDRFGVDRLRTALALAILLCTVGVAAAARQPSSPHPTPSARAPRAPRSQDAAGRCARGRLKEIHSGRNVFLSEVRTSRSEVPTKSKDPYVPPISEASAATTPAPEPPRPPPVAVYREGSLSLTAQNAPLGDILERVRESTGAVVEAPLLEERVSIQLGPQPPVQAITALLEGMHLNYVILGGTSDQDRLQYIIITTRPQPAGDSQSAAPAPARGLEEVAAKAQARALVRFAEETGGDEGVWDNRPQSPGARAPSSPARVHARE